MDIHHLLNALISGGMVLLAFLKLTNAGDVNKKANRYFGIFTLLWSTFWVDELFFCRSVRGRAFCNVGYPFPPVSGSTDVLPEYPVLHQSSLVIHRMGYPVSGITDGYFASTAIPAANHPRYFSILCSDANFESSAILYSNGLYSYKTASKNY